MSLHEHKDFSKEDSLYPLLKSLRHSLANRLMPLYLSEVDPSLFSPLKDLISAIDLLTQSELPVIYEYNSLEIEIYPNILTYLEVTYAPIKSLEGECLVLNFEQLRDKISTYVFDDFPHHFEMEILFALLLKLNAKYLYDGIFHVEAK
jgi:hypothetical protein